MNFEKMRKKKTDMPPLEADGEENLPQRENHGALWVTVLCVVVAIALLLSSLPTGAVSGSTVRSKVLSGRPEEKTIETYLYGAGTLTPQEGEDLEVPQALEISCRYVNNGDTVRAGTPILKVNKAQAAAAVAELQSLLGSIDSAIAKAGNQNNSTYVKATASGRVKKIYAQKDVAVADTMYEQGALVLLSLDGTMALDLPAGDLELGDSLKITLSGGKEEAGTVESISDGVAVITCSDETAQYGETVTVTKDGVSLGSGPLYIHSMLRVTGLSGTVSNVNVKEGRKVVNGSILLTLKDTGHTAEYARLLSRRLELEEHLEKLLKLSKDGILYAQTDGVVTGLGDDVDYESPASLQTGTRSLASPGYYRVGGILMDGLGESMAAESGSNTPEAGNSADKPADTGENTDGENPGNTGGVGGAGDAGEDTIRFVVGVVKDNVGGVIHYKLTGKSFDLTKEAMKEVNFAAYAAAEDDENYLELREGDVGLVLRSADGSWTTAGFGEIGPNDALLLGGGLVIFQSGGSLKPTTPAMPGGFNLNGMMNGMTGGSPSGLTAATQQKQAAYDTFDTTCTVAATVTQTQEMTVDMTVDELDILSIQEGMDAEITLDALSGRTYPGTITKINVYGENSGGNTKYTVTVTLPRAENMLSGMNASVRVRTAQSSKVTVVPAAAIQSKSGKSWLYTAYDEKTDTLSGLTQVETGLSDGETVQLKSGLPEGSTFYYRYADTIEYQFVG